MDDDRSAKVSKAALRKSIRIFRYLRPYRLIFGFGILMLIFTSLLSMAFPALMGRLVDATDPGNSNGVDLFNLNNIDSVALLLLIVFALQAAFGFARIYIFSYVTENVLMKLRQDTYEHVIKLPMSFFSQRRVGELNSRIAADVSILQDTFTTTLAEMFRQFIVIITGIVLLTWLSPKLTLIMLASVPIVAINAVLFGRFIRKLSKQAQDKIAETNVIVDETLQAIQSVKAFANEGWEALRYRKRTEEARGYALKGAKWRAIFVSFAILTIFSAIVFVIWKGVHMKQEGIITTGELMTFILYTVFIGASFGAIPDLFASILKAIGATEHLLDIQEEVAEPITLSPEDRQFLAIDGDIRFDHVGFHYPTRPDMNVLKDVSFQVKPGERVALVGPSGAGKSTIASLVLRLYDAVTGQVMIDGKPITELPLSALRDRMAIVPQEVLLFGGTIKENIAYGKPDATDSEIESAAAKANAKEFIDRFPDGYSTVVGERGVQLSGGQRQRVAIARAILKDPAILILDEATSSLDTASEQLVQEALERLMVGRTSIVIAHRLSTVKNADRILVLDQGQVTSSGTHDELIADEAGLYFRLSQSQFSGPMA